MRGSRGYSIIYILSVVCAFPQGRTGAVGIVTAMPGLVRNGTTTSTIKKRHNNAFRGIRPAPQQTCIAVAYQHLQLRSSRSGQLLHGSGACGKARAVAAAGTRKAGGPSSLPFDFFPLRQAKKYMLANEIGVRVDNTGRHELGMARVCPAAHFSFVGQS